MQVSMYQISVPVFVKYLTALSAILDTAAAHAAAHKIDPAVLPNTRLFPDMYSLAGQIDQATFHARNIAGKLAGVDVPRFPDPEPNFGALKERIAQSLDFVQSLSANQIDGTEDKEITMKFGPNTRNFTGHGFLLEFCLPNFWFHLTTAYAILRSNGVDIGKRDFMGSLPAA